MSNNFINRHFFPWTLLCVCLLSGFLYMLTGILPYQNVAQAAQPLEEKTQQHDGTDDEKIVQDPDFDQKTCQVNSRYPESIRQWCTSISYYSQKHNLNPNLIAALVWQESGGNPQAYSKSGAVGLMQVMPRDGIAASFRCPNGPCFANRPTITELQNPEFNLNYGTKMLSGLLKRQGSLREALKSYGPMDVGYYYADKVLGIYQTYK